MIISVKLHEDGYDYVFFEQPLWAVLICDMVGNESM